MLNNELQKRVVFGALAAAVAAVAVYLGNYPFYFFVGIISLIASLEFDKLRRDGKISFLFCAVPILITYIPLVALVLVAGSVVFIMLLQYIAKRRYPWLMVTIPYITLPAISLIWLRDQPYGMEAVFWLIIVIAVTDTFAYFAGRKFGKNPLAPKISPKKTWEGLAGGVLAASVVSFLYTGKISFALIAIVVAVLAQVSDLMESAIKRYFDVKDSGNFLPGHGGVMDRTDSLVLTAPLVALASAYGVLPW